MVTFDLIPNSIRVPGTYVEITARFAQQGLGVQAYKLLAFGQRLSTGSVAELEPVQVLSADDAAVKFGSGSMLHSMAQALFANNRSTEMIFCAIDDPAGGAQSSGTVTVSVSSPKGGNVYLYVGGRRYAVPVTTASTASSVASAIAAAIGADPAAEVTASANAAVVTLTAKHAGAIGDLIDIRENHFSDEQSPAGVSLAIVAMANGAGVVDVAEVIAAVGDTQYNVIANPYTDSANLDALEAELDSRAGPLRQIEGVAISAFTGTYGATVTLGNARNNEYSCIVGTNDSPTTPWAYAAAIAGIVAYHGAIDPARPFNTLPVDGVLGTRIVDLWDFTERKGLLFDGIALTTLAAGGETLIQRLITTYQLNAQGVPDASFLDLTTPLTLSRLRYDPRVLFATRYARHKLAADGTPAAAGANVVTPGLIRAEMIALASAWAELGWIEDLDGLKANLVVAIDSQDPSRVNIVITPNLVNGLQVVAMQIAFTL